jgi:hypothetical protein
MKGSFLKIILTVCLCAISLNGYSQDRYKSISSIEKQGEWYHIYDETGRQVKTMYARSTGELMGFASDFFIMKSGSWYYLYDVHCKRYKTLYAPNIGEILSVNSNGFVAKHGSWIYTYDRTGKKLNTRYSR